MGSNYRVEGIKVFNMKISSLMRWAGHVAHMGKRRCIYRVLVEKPEGKRPLGRPRHRREDNIRMDLQEVGCGGDRKSVV